MEGDVVVVGVLIKGMDYLFACTEAFCLFAQQLLWAECCLSLADCLYTGCIWDTYGHYANSPGNRFIGAQEYFPKNHIPVCEFEWKHLWKR